MNTRIIGVLLAALMYITLAAPAAMADATTPFIITGHVSDSNNNPCNGAWVRVTNTSAIVGWDAENDSASNYYKLVLDSDDVSLGNVLLFEASGCSESKIVEHTVTQSEMEEGGMIGFDIVIDVESMPDLTVTAIGTPVRLRADVINPISATVENMGSDNAKRFVVTLEAGGSIVDTSIVTSLNAGENTTVEFLWTPSFTGECTLNVTADANGKVTESDETNNILSQTETVLDTLTATVNVRIEGKNDTVWCGDVTFSSSVLTTSDGSIHYLNEPTALGALDEANEISGFGYVLVDYGWGLYVTEVAGEPAIDWDGWMYRVNYVSPWVGAPDYTLYGGEDVLWYFGAWTAPPLKIELDKTTVMTGVDFVATVTAYNGTSMAFEPVNGAGVYVDGALYNLTGTDGKLTMSLATAGDYHIHADKGTWADYTRSEKVDLTVTPPFTATYDFTDGAGIDKWAYRYQTDAKPPAANDVPGIEFVTATKPNKDQYAKISTDNRKMQSDSTDLEGYYAAHRFVFNISQPVEDILTIEVLWNGKGAHTDRKKSGATLYIWNGTGYEELDNTTSTKEVYLSAELTGGFGNYIEDGNLTLLVEQNSAQTVKGKRSLVSKLSTDYVKVDITHT